MATQPTVAIPEWATDATYDDPGKPWDGADTKDEPTSGGVAVGFTPEDEVPAETVNWLFNSVGQWLSYFQQTDSEVRSFVTLAGTDYRVDLAARICVVYVTSSAGYVRIYVPATCPLNPLVIVVNRTAGAVEVHNQGDSYRGLVPPGAVGLVACSVQTTEATFLGATHAQAYVAITDAIGHGFTLTSPFTSVVQTFANTPAEAPRYNILAGRASAGWVVGFTNNGITTQIDVGNDGGATLMSIGQGKSGEFVFDGTLWVPRKWP
jgi:hypothetical protein